MIRLFLRCVGYPTLKQPSSPDVMHTFWDYQSHPYALGDTITWQVQVCALAKQAGKKTVMIHVLADPAMPAFAAQRHAITAWNFKSHLARLFPVFLLNPMPGGVAIYLDRRSFEQDYLSLFAVGACVFPSGLTYARDYVLESTDFDSVSQPILAHFERTGEIARPRVPLSAATWAKGFLKSHEGKFVLCMHMRMRKASADAASGMSDLGRDGVAESWLRFLELLEQKYPGVLVVMLGQPGEWPREFLRKQNTLVLKTLGLGLLEELAMIQEGDLFMGTVSGPAEFAYFGTKPYVIIDSPEYHARSSARRGMDPEMRRPVFGVEHQHLHVGSPTGEELLELFESVYLRIHTSTGGKVTT